MLSLQSAVGDDWVFSSEEDVALYRDSYSIYWGEPEERVASAAVAPANVEQVQQIVRIANKHRIPLYPISTGRNLTYGGSAPTLSGSVIVDLKRMNRILEVDEDRHFAVVEPGVSYFDLYNYITERGLKVMLDVPDPGWGSPIGNSLDHGVGYTMAPFRDHFGSHCGMEVVTAEGDVIRTGNGAMPDSESWQDYRYGVGPVGGRAVRAVELRHRHEDGFLADAAAGDVLDRYGHGPALPGFRCAHQGSQLSRGLLSDRHAAVRQPRERPALSRCHSRVGAG